MTLMVAASDLSERQLSLGFWPEESDSTAEIRHLKYIAALERDAESALFDWTERRNASDAASLWRIFASKSELLNRALAERSQSSR